MVNIFPYSVKVDVPYTRIPNTFLVEEANADEFISWLEKNIGPSGELWCNQWIRKSSSNEFDWYVRLGEQMEFFFARQEDYVRFNLVYGQ